MDWSSKIEKLAKLQKLLEAGVLTKEELEEQKKNILETKENEELNSPSNVDSKNLDHETSFFQKYKKTIVGALAIMIVAVLSFQFFQTRQLSQCLSNNNSGEEKRSIVGEDEQDSIYLVNSVSEDLHYVFCLKIQGKNVSGYTTLAGDYPRRSLVGTIDQDRWLIIKEVEGKEPARFEGKLNSDSFSGTLFPQNGEETSSWNAKRMTKKQLNELESKVRVLIGINNDLEKWFETYGKVIVQSDGQDYDGYLSKDYLSTIQEWNNSKIGERWNPWLYNIGAPITITKFKCSAIYNITKSSASAIVDFEYRESVEDDYIQNCSRIVNLIFENEHWVIDDIDNSKELIINNLYQVAQ